MRTHEQKVRNPLMSAQYDGIADAYKRTKTSPLREHVEAYSFLRMLGDLQGLRVLDLACGDGFYTRAIAAAGAAEVVGVDISADMLTLARGGGEGAGSGGDGMGGEGSGLGGQGAVGAARCVVRSGGSGGGWARGSRGSRR